MISTSTLAFARQSSKFGIWFHHKSLCLMNQSGHSRYKNLSATISNSLHTTQPSKDLMEFFDDKDNWGEDVIKIGRSWKIEELRLKSNSDLHKLWYVLLKERNMLLSMEHECKEAVEIFPNPERVDKVNESMHNLEEVVIERNKAYHELETGESGLRPTREVINQLGLPFCYKMTEHTIPKQFNTKWKETHVFRDKYVETKDFLDLLDEERRRFARNNIKGQEKIVLGLLQRFPNVDIEAIKEKYPDVNVDKIKDTNEARSHSIP